MSGLRIAMASPWNTSSAIAQCASEISFELARRGHAVTALRIETGSAADLPARPVPGAIRHMSEYEDFELKRDFDLIICHFGNNYPFHGAALPRLDTVPMVGVIHDICIPHLMRPLVNDDENVLRRMVHELYPNTAAANLPFHWNDLAYIAEHHPLIEWITRRTIGAVAHADHYADRLRRDCPGPTAVIPLAFDVVDMPPPPPPSNRMVIAVVGHANSNKRIDQIILAVSASHLLRGRCRIRIIGEASPEVRLHLIKHAEELGIPAPEFTGWVSDDEMRWKLRDVDVIACLRNPIFEGASASLIVGLRSGRPVLITNHGCYSEVPRDAALVCEPHSEALDMMLHLEHIVRNPSFGTTTGERGRVFAEHFYTAVTHVDALEPFLDACLREQPLHNARRLFKGILAEFGLPDTDPLAVRATTVMDGMASQ